jgi:hypothetical protein
MERMDKYESSLTATTRHTRHGINLLKEQGYTILRHFQAESNNKINAKFLEKNKFEAEKSKSSTFDLDVAFQDDIFISHANELASSFDASVIIQGVCMYVLFFCSIYNKIYFQIIRTFVARSLQRKMKLIKKNEKRDEFHLPESFLNFIITCVMAKHGEYFNFKKYMEARNMHVQNIKRAKLGEVGYKPPLKRGKSLSTETISPSINLFINLSGLIPPPAPSCGPSLQKKSRMFPESNDT